MNREQLDKETMNNPNKGIDLDAINAAIEKVNQPSKDTKTDYAAVKGYYDTVHPKRIAVLVELVRKAEKMAEFYANAKTVTGQMHQAMHDQALLGTCKVHITEELAWTDAEYQTKAQEFLNLLRGGE